VIDDINLPIEMIKLNMQDNIITFENGSKIFLMDMAYQPSDPEYLRFGGLELDGAFVDESNECDLKALHIITSRIGRGKSNLPPKLLETFNPSKNHIYSRYYMPYKTSTFDDKTVFIPSLPTDNPFLTEEYISMLHTLPEVQKQRLLHGNFDYDEDDRALCSFDKILDCFSNTFLKEQYISSKSYISADLAMQGRDNFVVTHWLGLWCMFRGIYGKSTGKEIEEKLKEEAEKTHTPRSQIVYDYDGMGNYLDSYFKGANPFKNGSRALDNQTYRNLKSECAFKLAELINEGKIFIDVDDDEYIRLNGKDRQLKEVIMEELSQLKRDNLDKDDQKLKIISKEEMKDNLGRSPDFLDCLLMRCFFEIKPSYGISF
jgi:phage terminase large subunit